MHILFLVQYQPQYDSVLSFIYSGGGAGARVDARTFVK